MREVAQVVLLWTISEDNVNFGQYLANIYIHNAIIFDGITVVHEITGRRIETMTILAKQRSYVML